MVWGPVVTQYNPHHWHQSVESCDQYWPTDCQARMVLSNIPTGKDFTRALSQDKNLDNYYFIHILDSIICLTTKHQIIIIFIHILDSFICLTTKQFSTFNMMNISSCLDVIYDIGRDFMETIVHTGVGYMDCMDCVPHIQRIRQKSLIPIIPMYIIIIAVIRIRVSE